MKKERQHLFATLNPKTDLDWQKEMKSAEAVDCVKLKATDILYIVYTSGTARGYKVEIVTGVKAGPKSLLFAFRSTGRWLATPATSLS